MFCYPPVLPLSSHPSLSSSMSSTSWCRLQRPVQTNRISTLTSLSLIRSFFLQWRVGSITVYIFIASQIELKIETAVSQKLNFTPRGRLLNFPIQIWERERPVRQKICISNWHWLSIFVINWVLNETVFFFNQKGLVVGFIKSGWQKNWTGIGICERDSGKRILWKLIWVAWRDLDLKYW